MIEDEGHSTTMEKVLQFAAGSFERLLPKIQHEVMTIMGTRLSVQLGKTLDQNFFGPTFFLDRNFFFRT